MQTSLPGQSLLLPPQKYSVCPSISTPRGSPSPLPRPLQARSDRPCQWDALGGGRRRMPRTPCKEPAAHPCLIANELSKERGRWMPAKSSAAEIGANQAIEPPSA